MNTRVKKKTCLSKYNTEASALISISQSPANLTFDSDGKATAGLCYMEKKLFFFFAMTDSPIDWCIGLWQSSKHHHPSWEKEAWHIEWSLRYESHVKTSINGAFSEKQECEGIDTFASRPNLINLQIPIQSKLEPCKV